MVWVSYILWKTWVHIKWLLQDFYIDDVSTKFHQPNFSTSRNSGFGKSPDDHGSLLTKTKGLKSKPLFETTCYASISQMFGGWWGRNSDVTYIPKWNGFYRLDYLTGFQGLNNLGWHRPDLKSLSHFRENSPYALSYSSTALFKPPLFVSTLSVTFSYQIHIDKISKKTNESANECLECWYHPKRGAASTTYQQPSSRQCRSSWSITCRRVKVWKTKSWEKM